MDEFLFPRQINTCYGNKQWYVCSKGDFRGCCSSDPCTTGICPDDVNSSLSSSSSTTSSSTTTTSTSSSSTTSTTSDATSASSSSTTTTLITTTSPGVVPTHSSSDSSTISQTTRPTGHSSAPSTTAQTTSTTTASSASKGHTTSHAAIIGGVVGGVVALILCVIMVLLCCHRKRRGKGKRFTLIDWRQPTKTQDMRTLSSADGPWSENGTGSKGKQSKKHHLPSSTHVSLTGIGPSSLPASSVPKTPDPTTFSNCVPGALTASSSGSSILDYSTNQTVSTAPSMTSPETTPELSDTGFYRTRAELAAHSQLELINVPLEQRKPKNLAQRSPQQRHHSSSRRWDSSPTSTSGNNTPLQRNKSQNIVTADGVMLSANFNQHSNSENENEYPQLRNTSKSEHSNARSHVLSFMQFESDLEQRLSSSSSSSRQRERERERESPGGGGGSEKEKSNRNDSTTASKSPPPTLFMVEEDVASPSNDVPPVYETDGAEGRRDVKSPSVV